MHSNTLPNEEGPTESGLRCLSGTAVEEQTLNHAGSKRCCYTRQQSQLTVSVASLEVSVQLPAVTMHRYGPAFDDWADSIVSFDVFAPKYRASPAMFTHDAPSLRCHWYVAPEELLTPTDNTTC